MGPGWCETWPTTTVSSSPGAGSCCWGPAGPPAGCSAPCWRPGSAGLTIANRTADRARELAALVADLGPVTGCGLDGLAGVRFDLIINATSAGLGGAVPPVPDDCLATGAWTYDMLYGDAPTPFCRWGQGHGATKTLDGLGMLVEQAAESFRVWRGVSPQTAPVIALLRAGSA